MQRHRCGPAEAGRCRRLALIIALLALSSGVVGVRAQPPAAPDGIVVLLHRLEQAIQSGDTAQYFALLASGSDRNRAVDFTSTELFSGATRVVLQERDRQPLQGALPGNGFRLMVDEFAEYGGRARAATWFIDVKRVGDAGTDTEWAIVDETRVSSVESLYRLAINTTKQYFARDLKLAAEDLELTLTQGTVFVVDVDQGITGLVLLGSGTMTFHPAPPTEQGQVRIFCGSDSLQAKFEALFVRFNPNEYQDLLTAPNVEARAVDAREVKRAQDLFRVESQKSFVLDLGDLSRDAWSLLPGPGDFLAEVHTRRYDTLTYTKSATEAEDISLFDRKHHRNISIYASKDRLAQRGRFYSEDDLVDYDVLDYNIDVTVIPERQWIEGRARILLKVRAPMVGTLTMKLADSLNVQGIASTEYGRLFAVRVKDQNVLMINLPTAVQRDKILLLNIVYSGRLEPQSADRETIALEQTGRPAQEDVPFVMAPEAKTLYSSRSFWYPQAPYSDYSTATLRITVPATLDCVASGELQPGYPVLIPAKEATPSRKQYAFIASQPVRYLAMIISRFVRAETVTLAFPDTNFPNDPPLTGSVYRSMNLSVEANPRQVARARELVERAADIALFYESLIGDSPYPDFTVALVENDLPGGHSPGYFAALNQPLPTTTLSWRNDPAAFTGFPDFFIAHELAHQWWGQAVGWRNYHEQWLSEGFAQYFAALYAQHERGEDTFASVMRQCRRWAIDQSDQGPIYLGYRLGHIRGESRVFRALVYNKGAAVLHMLRRFVGDDAFFRGVRRFYRTSRFKKAGTEDFRAAMEAESGRPLERFFEGWIYGSALPRVRFTYRVDGNEVVLRAEQTGETFDFPLVISLEYADARPAEIVFPVADRECEMRVPLAGTLRSVDVNRDATLAEVTR